MLRPENPPPSGVGSVKNVSDEGTVVTLGKRLPWGMFPSPEGIEYNWRNGQHLLYLALTSPHKEEVKAVEKEESEFALIRMEGLLLLLFRFGATLPWSEAPYAVQFVPEEEFVPIDRNFDDLGHALLTLLLVNAGTGTVKAMRAVTFSPEFTRELYEDIARQEDVGPLTQEEYTRRLEKIRREYPTVEELLPHAVAQCYGGD